MGAPRRAHRSGAGQPARVDRITTNPPGNAFLVGSLFGAGGSSLYLREWSPADGRWVPFATIDGPSSAITLTQLPYYLAISASGRTSFWTVAVPSGAVARVDLGPSHTAPFVFAARELHHYGAIWIGTERDIFRTDRHGATGPYTHLPIREGVSTRVRDFLERPAGVVLVAASDPAQVYITEDGATFVSASEGLPTGAADGVHRLTSLRGVVYAMTRAALYRGRSSVLECGLAGDACAGADCCSGTCSGGVCASDACGADGAACHRSSGCCSGHCAEGTCRVRDPERCGTAGDGYASRAGCCRGDCADGRCVDLSHCRCEPGGACGAPDGCGGSCPGACPSGTVCQETARGWDFCGVPCTDWRDCRRVEPSDDTYCCASVDGVGTCLGSTSACDTECAPAGGLCGPAAGLGCCDPDPTDGVRPICCPADVVGYANTCSCSQHVFP